MFDQILNGINKHELFTEQDRLLLAVSGGVDSMVMLQVLSQLSITIAVAHMNYQLRGMESDEDEDFVREWCEKKGIKVFTKKVSLTREGKSTQMEARELRYSWFEYLASANQYDKIVTAHHLNDSLETVLLNLSKGTGLAGLNGIARINGRVIRPLIDFPKKEITEYASAIGLKWREDRSNHESNYQRNLVRNEIIPLLQKINPSLEKTFKNTLDRMAGASLIVQNKVHELVGKIEWEREEVRIALDWKSNDGSNEALLYEILRPTGINYSTVLELTQTDVSGKIFETSTHVICTSNGELIITRSNRDDFPEVEIHDEGGASYGPYSAMVQFVKDFSVTSSDVAIVDCDKIAFPIRIRPWRNGDVFIPLGMTGKKKVSDFMIDMKIPLTLKREVPIFESNGQIIWIAGYRVDERVKVTPGTKRFLRLEIKKS